MFVTDEGILAMWLVIYAVAGVVSEEEGWHWWYEVKQLNCRIKHRKTAERKGAELWPKIQKEVQERGFKTIATPFIAHADHFPLA